MTAIKTSTKLSLLLITFILPMVISWILFYYHEHFHFKTTNHGILINPPIQTETLFQNKAHHRAWQIVYAPTVCNKDECDKIMFALSQLRKALGKDYQRVALTLITNSTFKPQLPYDFNQTTFTQQQIMLLKKEFKQEKLLTGKIYLIDPAGNLFMYYASTVNPMDILKDLKHLLGVSQIG